jgi:hypothetical protein
MSNKLLREGFSQNLNRNNIGKIKSLDNLAVKMA